MNQLALETSTEHCSVALQIDDRVLTRDALEPRSHARLILPWARELLAEAGIGFADLDSLAVSRGPGGFTSLRIGLSIVQGIALAHDLPVHTVSSLDALAINIAHANPDRPFLALLDARMGEVYVAGYQPSPSGPQRVGEERLLAPEQLSPSEEKCRLIAGPGARQFGDLLQRSGFELVGEDHSWPNARTVLRLASLVQPVAGYEIQPVYLRDQVTG